jgi:hypothetical protein
MFMAALIAKWIRVEKARGSKETWRPEIIVIVARYNLV